MEKLFRAIVIVDYDEGAQMLIKQAYQQLSFGHQLVLLKNASELIEYLHYSKTPFFILSEYNLPSVNGLQLRDMILNDPLTRYKSVPFLLWSKSTAIAELEHSYERLVQGFFMKPVTIVELKDLLNTIIDYWTKNLHPFLNHEKNTGL